MEMTLFQTANGYEQIDYPMRPYQSYDDDDNIMPSYTMERHINRLFGTERVAKPATNNRYLVDMDQVMILFDTYFEARNYVMSKCLKMRFLPETYKIIEDPTRLNLVSREVFHITNSGFSTWSATIFYP